MYIYIYINIYLDFLSNFRSVCWMGSSQDIFLVSPQMCVCSGHLRKSHLNAYTYIHTYTQTYRYTPKFSLSWDLWVWWVP